MVFTCSLGHQVNAGQSFCSQCGEPLAGANGNGKQPLPLAPKTQVGGHFIVQEQIGRGGFGRTYIAIDTSRFNEHVLIKEFAPLAQGTAALQKAEELFNKEAQTLYKLNHQQIPKFRETFREGNRIFLVQDYIPGNTYYSLLQQGKHFGSSVLAMLNY